MKKHEYYRFNKAQLLTNPKIPLRCKPDNETVFRDMAGQMADEIRLHNSRGETTVMICPVGPVGQYPYFIQMVNDGGISLKQVWLINMDEYLDQDGFCLSGEHPLSFRGYMERNVYQEINPELLMPKEQRVFPDPACPSEVTDLIDQLGGADIVFGGIGINGHIAFNEPDEALSPEAFLQLTARRLAIAPETRTANAIGDFNGALEEMPRECVTIGMYEIARAKKIRLGCFRSWHRGVVRRAAHGDISTGFPVTLLQNHGDVSITMTDYVANITM